MDKMKTLDRLKSIKTYEMGIAYLASIMGKEAKITVNSSREVMDELRDVYMKTINSLIIRQPNHTYQPKEQIHNHR